jgi:hypothetical protein
MELLQIRNADILQTFFNTLKRNIFLNYDRQVSFDRWKLRDLAECNCFLRSCV